MTPIEQEIIDLWNQGLMIEEISEELGISESRVFTILDENNEL